MLNQLDADRVSIAVYILDPASQEPAVSWITRMQDASEGSVQLDINYYHSKDDATLAPFDGRPFVIAGSASRVSGYFQRCPPEAIEVLNDCAYYWVLTDTDRLETIPKLNLSSGRAVWLSWHSHFYNVVYSRLKQLARYRHIGGLSHATHEIRDEIARIGEAEQGAFSPVLILGEPGSGKELVASALWSTFQRWKRSPIDEAIKPAHREAKLTDKPAKSMDAVPGFNQARGKYKQLACGWFTEDLLQDQLFGHEKDAFTGATSKREGLLETYVNGCIFLDDFDVAPHVTQGALLRVMSTDRDEPAEFNRLGGTEPVLTNAWLLFATNADIEEKIHQGEIRPDFLYRFEDRVIHLRSLNERIADIPQIAQRLWSKLWHGLRDPLNLTGAHMQFILSQHVKWEGNIRQLRALLSLASARARISEDSLRAIFSSILSRGDYAHWVGVILDQKCRRTNSTRGPLTADDFTPPACLTTEGLNLFRDVYKDLPKTRAPGTDDVRVRLGRILEEVARAKTTKATRARQLNSGSPATAQKDLELLAGAKGKKPLLKATPNGEYSGIPGIFQ